MLLYICPYGKEKHMKRKVKLVINFLFLILFMVLRILLSILYVIAVFLKQAAGFIFCVVILLSLIRFNEYWSYSFLGTQQAFIQIGGHVLLLLFLVSPAYIIEYLLYFTYKATYKIKQKKSMY